MDKMLNVCLVYFLKELMFAVFQINMNEPYFIVDFEEFTMFLEIELCGSYMSTESKCHEIIEKLLNILRKQIVKLRYKEMDMKTFRKIITIYGQEIDVYTDKNSRKKAIGILLNAFRSTLGCANLALLIRILQHFSIRMGRKTN